MTELLAAADQITDRFTVGTAAMIICAAQFYVALTGNELECL